ncbi:hypothetical protein niasHT_009961 [Heterodera trifolii]|uniref:Uncharacterized protein n=1 Tax=Heterodera trifolii TaxID=157864 RepID=A0ABD2LMT9_9BILA
MLNLWRTLLLSFTLAQILTSSFTFGNVPIEYEAHDDNLSIDAIGNVSSDAIGNVSADGSGNAITDATANVSSDAIGNGPVDASGNGPADASGNGRGDAIGNVPIGARENGPIADKESAIVRQKRQTWPLKVAFMNSFWRTFDPKTGQLRTNAAADPAGLELGENAVIRRTFWVCCD